MWSRTNRGKSGTFLVRRLLTLWPKETEGSGVWDVRGETALVGEAVFG